MSIKKCRMLLAVCLSFILFIPFGHASESTAWQKLKNIYFPDREIREQANDILRVELPEKVEDAAVMPVTIRSFLDYNDDYYIKTLYLIVDNNPQPYSGVFHLSPELGAVSLSTRIRMERASNVRVIAEMSDNSLHMIEKLAIASGGCSAPVSKSPDEQTQIGKVKIRMRKPEIGKQAAAQVIVRHPNANGLQMRGSSNEYIPMHYVTHFDIYFNDKPLIIAETGFTLSEDPSIRFNFTPETTGVLKVKIKDSENNVFEAEKKISEVF